MSIELKIKSKHLALEPAIIKREERKVQRQLKWFMQHHQITDVYADKDAFKIHKQYYDLHNHRKWNVRNEARATYLARAYLAGKKYKSIEAKTDIWFVGKIIQPRIVDMVARYGRNPIRKYNLKDGRYDYRPDEIAKVMEAVNNWLFKG